MSYKQFHYISVYLDYISTQFTKKPLKVHPELQLKLEIIKSPFENRDIRVELSRQGWQ